MAASDLVESFGMPDIAYPTARGTLVFKSDWLPTASLNNRRNRGNAPWKNSHHIVLNDVESPHFLADVWEHIVQKDWIQPSIQKLYKLNADGSYSMYDADRPSVNGPVMTGPLAKVLLRGIIGRPILAGEYARCGFRLIDKKGSWLLDDAHTLTTKESGDSTHLKTKSIPVLKIKQGLPDERKINGHLRYYEDAICHIGGSEYYLTKEFFDASFDPLTSFFKDRNVSLQEIVDELNSVEKVMYNGSLGPLQRIVYGAPGTGKSYYTKRETEGCTVFRTTFHPDSDYSTFVGAYKPTMKSVQRINCAEDKAILVKDEDGAPSMQNVISYDFVPQDFMKAYVEAWKKMSSPLGDGPSGLLVEPVYLVIEEINRGNCAQIFGDLFQLLDRDADGFSDYPIEANSDIKRYLAQDDVLGRLCVANLVKCGVKAPLAEAVVAGSKLVLPRNLYIRATMNTSDQSLFPIDSAFKRRWDWQYVPISKPVEDGFKDRKIRVKGKDKDTDFDWWDFISIINSRVWETTKSEDKQLGYFFVKAPDDTGIITEEQFVNKVLFYLYNDVFKDYDYPAAVFGRKVGDKKDGEKYAFHDFFHREKEADKNPGDIKSDVVMEFLSGLEFEGKKISTKDVAHGPAPAPGQTPAAGSETAGPPEPAASSGTDSGDAATSSSSAPAQQQ